MHDLPEAEQRELLQNEVLDELQGRLEKSDSGDILITRVVARSPSKIQRFSLQVSWSGNQPWSTKFPAQTTSIPASRRKPTVPCHQSGQW